MAMVIQQENLQVWFEKLVVFAVQRHASDIFINSGLSVALKIDGVLSYLSKFMLDKDGVYALIKLLSRAEVYQSFLATNELNMMVEIPGVAYLRVNAYMQRNVPGMVLRIMPAHVPTLEELKLPQISFLQRMAMAKYGLIIVAGSTRSGKSSTLAAMINYRNRHSKNHIITIEDPIKFMHSSQKSIVIQREIGVDTKSYDSALKNLLREVPDVVLIGEIRDSKTMSYAVHFAETGHLCLATINATSTVQTLARICNFFPLEQRENLRLDLANNLSCVITQQLLPRCCGGQIAALEVMVNTVYSQQLLAEGRLDKIPEAIARGNPDCGMLSFDVGIFDLYERNEISYKTALQYVNSPNDFRIRLRAQSKRELPEELKTTGELYTV